MMDDSSSAFRGLLEEIFGLGGQDVIGGADISIGTSVFGVLLLVLIIGAVALLISAAVYVIQAIAVMRMAKMLDVEKPWFAWIPIAQGYLMGQIAERCDGRRGIDVKPWGKIMLYVNIGYVGFAAVYSIASGVLPMIPLIGYVLIVLLWVVYMAVLLAYMVINYICIWKMFREFFPETVNVVVFVVSILFNAHFIGMLVATFFPLRPSADEEMWEIKDE